MSNILNDERTAFWAALSEAAPEFGIEASPGWEKEVPIGYDGRLKIKLSLSQDKSSVYLVARSKDAEDFVNAHIGELARHLRTSVGEATGEAMQKRWFRKDNPKACVTVRSQWPEAIRWFRAQHATFTRAMTSVDGSA